MRWQLHGKAKSSQQQTVKKKIKKRKMNKPVPFLHSFDRLGREPPTRWGGSKSLKNLEKILLKKFFTRPQKNLQNEPKQRAITGKNLAEKTDNLKTFWETFLAPHPENFNQLVNKWSSGTRLQTTKPNSRFPSVTAEKRNFQAGRSGEKASDISPISFHFFKEWIEAGGRGYNTMRIIQSLINGCLVIDRDGCRP